MSRGRAAAGAIVIALALSGCSSDGDGDNSDAQDPPTTPATESSSAATSAAPSMTLKEICPQIEAALPGGMLPKAEKLAAFIKVAEDLQLQGDLEAQNAIPLLLGPSKDLYDVVSAGGQGSALTDAVGPYIDGISAFATRCKAAGSSALQ